MVKSNFSSNRRMGATFQLRADALAGALRAAHGRNASLLYKRRAQLLDETIYRRPALRNARKRKLTGTLKRSERLEIHGNTYLVKNTAPYADLRARMTGRSKLFGHDLRSRWAARAVQETASARAATIRRALREVWNIRA